MTQGIFLLWIVLTIVIVLLASIVLTQSMMPGNTLEYFVKHDIINIVILDVIIVFFSFIIAFIFRKYTSVYTNSSIAYEITIDDSVSFSDVIEKYEVIDIDENIITIVEKSED